MPADGFRQEGHMMSAMVVIALGGLTLPIVMVLGALVYDAVFIAWMAFAFWRDEWHPRMSRTFRDTVATAWHRMPHPHFR